MKKKYYTKLDAYLGQVVQLKIDRPKGTAHPEYPDLIYPINYGYIPNTRAADAEEIDVYLLGVDEPVQDYSAKVIAVVHRIDDKEDKLVAAPVGMHFHLEQIRNAIHFQERFYRTRIKLDPARPLVTFYRADPNAPKTTMPTKLGANAIITCNGKLLLEKRRDSDTWGLVGGGVEKTETALHAITREIHEEIGLRVSEQALHRLAVYGEPGRIAAYRDGSIWRMVVIVFGLELSQFPELTISRESRELRFFEKDELCDIEIVATHSDIVEDLFLKA